MSKVMEQTKMTETRTDPIIGSAVSDHDAHSSSLDDGASKAPSKSAMKKAAKAERYAASKLERRAKEKEAKKEKKRLKAEKRAAGELDDDDEENNRRKKRARLQFGGKIVIDLDFDTLMNEKVGGVGYLWFFRSYDKLRK
jgi:tRNA (guanine9-N1)-methyltransferase